MSIQVNPKGHTYLQRLLDRPEDHMTDLVHGDVVIKGARGMKMVYQVLSSTGFYDAVVNGELNEMLRFVDAIVIVRIYTGREPSPAALYDFMNGVQRHHPVFICESYNHAVDFLRKERRRMEEGTYGLWLTARHVSKEAPTANMLCMIPTIGYKTSERIVEVYPTMTDIVSALMQDTFEVDGVGKKTKKVLREYLTGEEEEAEEVE